MSHAQINDCLKALGESDDYEEKKRYEAGDILLKNVKALRDALGVLSATADKMLGVARTMELYDKLDDWLLECKSARD